jgi:hypothetical protein
MWEACAKYFQEELSMIKKAPIVFALLVVVFSIVGAAFLTWLVNWSMWNALQAKNEYIASLEKKVSAYSENPTAPVPDNKTGPSQNSTQSSSDSLYMANKIRDWLDEIGFPSHIVKPKKDELFRVTVPQKNGPTIVIIQDNKPDALAAWVTQFELKKEYQEKLKKLPPEKQRKMMQNIHYSHLQLGIQHGLELDEKQGKVWIQIST